MYQRHIVVERAVLLAEAPRIRYPIAAESPSSAEFLGTTVPFQGLDHQYHQMECYMSL